MSKSVIINDINNASPNVTTHIIPAIRAINKGSNYDDLGNKPVYNINLLEEGFEPIEGEYYRHTGETNNTFTTGVIYYYKEGEENRAAKFETVFMIKKNHESFKNDMEKDRSLDDSGRTVGYNEMLQKNYYFVIPF